MRVSVEIPERQWWRLAGIAERRGTTVAAMIEHLLLRTAGDETARQAAARARRDRVVDLARLGLMDAVIAERTGETKQYVAGVRRAAGIRAAKKPGKAREEVRHGR